MVLLTNSSFYAVFSHIKPLSGTGWVSCHSTQLWHCLPRDGIRFQRLRTQSYKTPLHFRCQFQAQVVTCASDQLALSQRCPCPLPLQRELKDMNEQSDEEIQGTRSGKVWSPELLSLWSCSVPLSQHMGVLNQRGPLNLVLLALLWRLHHKVLVDHLLGLQLHAPSQKMEDGAENSKLQTMVSSLWDCPTSWSCPGAHQEMPQ